MFFWRSQIWILSLQSGVGPQILKLKPISICSLKIMGKNLQNELWARPVPSDSYYGMISDCDLPNSCFRSGYSLGRVSMIDGCLSHMINDQVRHFDFINKKILPCPERCLIRGPEVLGSWGEREPIFTLHCQGHRSPQYLHFKPCVSKSTSDSQTQFVIKLSRH